MRDQILTLRKHSFLTRAPCHRNHPAQQARWQSFPCTPEILTLFYLTQKCLPFLTTNWAHKFYTAFTYKEGGGGRWSENITPSPYFGDNAQQQIPPFSFSLYFCPESSEGSEQSKGENLELNSQKNPIYFIFGCSLFYITFYNALYLLEIERLWIKIFLPSSSDCFPENKKKGEFWQEALTKWF